MRRVGMNNEKQLGLMLAVALACHSSVATELGLGESSSQRDKNHEAPMAATEANALDKQMRTMVEQASADLVERLGEKNLSPGDVEILYAERVVWRSSAMGCPMPDRGYKMVLTPGVRIVLRTAGKDYEFHGSRGGTPFLCEPPASIETPAPGRSSLDPT
ncbi:MAG: hypothetical protein AAF662_08020 [Pseudomonadota bacterium]